MDKKSLSFFVVGLILGLLAATVIFSLVLRRNNITAAGGNQKSDKIILKLAHGLDQKHPVHIAMEYMAKRLAELSGGTVELQIYPNGQLGTETANIEQLQRGALAMAKTSTAPLESFVPQMAVFGLPYIFRNEKHYWDVLNGPIGKELLHAGSKVGLYGLCYYDSGSRSFYTIKKPILKPSDLIGMKIRVMKSKTAMDMVAALGGSPTPVPWSELYTALQQGMVDGAENNPPSFYTSRHFEVCKYYSLDEHTMIPDILMMSKKVWDKLPEKVQKWVQQAADESSVYERKLWKKKTAEALAAVQNYGVKIYHPNKQLFIDKVKPMYKKYDGTVVGDLLKRIRNVK